MFKFKNLAVAAVTTAALVLPVTGAVILATPVPAEAKKSKKKSGEEIEIKAGTEIEGKLTKALDSGKNKDDDTFTMNVSTGWFGDKTLKGAVINGHLEGVKKAGAMGKKAEMEIVFDEIEMPSGKTFSIDAQLTSVPKPEGKMMRNAAIVLGGAIAGHHVGKKANKKGGALAGAAAATAVALSLPGGDIKFKKGAKLKFKLKESVTIEKDEN